MGTQTPEEGGVRAARRGGAAQFTSAQRKPLIRAAQVGAVGAGLGVLVAAWAAGASGMGALLGIFVGAFSATLAGVMLFIEPARGMREDIRRLETRIERLSRQERDASFDLLDMPRDHELAGLARAMKRVFEEHHRYRLAAVRNRREMQTEVSRQTRVATAHLERRANTDPLTGLSNRRALTEGLERLFEEAKGAGDELAVLAFDMDLFKELNDRDGHAAGDRVIEAFGQVLLAQFRLGDLAARVGGDEFIVALPAAHEPDALRIATRVQAMFAAVPLPEADAQTRPTLSIGIAFLQRDRVRTPDELLRLADAALYAAKRSGRGQVCSRQGRAAA